MTVEFVKSSGCDLRMQKACDRNMAAIGNFGVWSRQAAALGRAGVLTWGAGRSGKCSWRGWRALESMRRMRWPWPC